MLSAIIADDEPAVASIISYFLQADEIPVRIAGTASDGAQAIQLINELRPDLAFLDIIMPLHTGFEVMEKALQTKFIHKITFLNIFCIFADILRQYGD